MLQNPRVAGALRAGTTSSAFAAAAVGGVLSFLSAVDPAGSTEGGPAPSPVVSSDCSASGFTGDGHPCVAGPATGQDAGAGTGSGEAAPQPPPPAPAPPPAPSPQSSTPVPPAPAGTTTPARPEPRRQRRRPATRIGRKRVESRRPAPRERRRRARPAPAGSNGTAGGTGTAPVPSLSFTAPGPAAPVPDVLLDRFPIPPFLLPIYQAAGIEYDVPWQVLAAINEIESDYGRNLNVSSAGAMGWMQFIPSSWRAYGVDANDDGKKDPYNPVDAIFAAARYLKAAGAKQDLRRSIYAYNHAWWYVDSVMLRAKLVRALPGDLVGALTGLSQGHFPVAAPTRYERGHRPRRRAIALDARRGAAVVAVNDGVVQRVGHSRRLGNYVVLEDAYGNRYSYAHLGSLSTAYPAPRQGALDVAPALKAPGRDRRPTGPASAGSQSRTAKHARRRPVLVRVAKERLFAHPARPAALSAGGAKQLAARGIPLPEGTSAESYFTVPFPLSRKDVVLKALRPGAQVIGGTILGRAGRRPLRFAVRPAGPGAPRIDPKPILDGWRLLAATRIHDGGPNSPLRRAGGALSVGQILLMGKEALARRVLADRHIDLYGCGRRDIAAGAIDRRVLATLAYLSASGLSLRVSSLQCGHSYYTKAGGVSAHSSGNAVDIAAVDGVPILGHQGRGSITESTIRKLLSLQGTMRPAQIISLMKFPEADNTLVLSDHDDHIHVGFDPGAGDRRGPGSLRAPALLRPGQWTRLASRLDTMENPRVPGADLPAPRPRRHRTHHRVVIRLPDQAPRLVRLPPAG